MQVVCKFVIHVLGPQTRRCLKTAEINPYIGKIMVFCSGNILLWEIITFTSLAWQKQREDEGMMLPFIQKSVSGSLIQDIKGVNPFSTCDDINL